MGGAPRGGVNDLVPGSDDVGNDVPRGTFFHTMSTRPASYLRFVPESPQGASHCHQIARILASRGSLPSCPTDPEALYRSPVTNAQRAFTEARSVTSPGSTGVGAAAPATPARIAGSNIGVGKPLVSVISSRSPSRPPAARAMASASDRAFTTASASAARRASSALDDEN